MNLKTYHIPYSHSLLPLELPEQRVVFEADLPALEPMHDWKERLVQKLDALSFCSSNWFSSQPRARTAPTGSCTRGVSISSP